MNAEPLRADLKCFAPTSEMSVDAGIKHFVLILRAAGIETFESCQGGPEHAFCEPTIRFHGNAWEGFKAFSVAMSNGLPVSAVRYVWDVDEGTLKGPCWEVTFRTTGPIAD